MQNVRRSGLVAAVAGGAATATGDAARAGVALLIVLALLGSRARPARAQDPTLAAALDSVVAAATAAHRVPGAVVAVVRGNRILALRGFGMADPDSGTVADPERSAYRLASVAKLFVANVVLQQVARGRLRLDQPIAELAPDVRVDTRFAEPVTLRHLLTHTGGFDERMIGYAAPTRAAMRPLGVYLADRMPARGWPPGTLIGYSNHGMALAAYAAERAAGEPFARLAARDLFEPLGMARTYYIEPPADSLRADQVPGFRCGGDGCSRVPVTWSHAYPVGLAYSTAADMARFLQAQLLVGRGNPAAPLESAEGEALAQGRQFTHHPALPGIGFAYFEQEYRGVRLLTHAGGVPGAATVLALAPDADLGVFVATNAGEPGFVKLVLNGVLDRLLPAAPFTPPVASGSVEEYAGFYRLARFSHFTVERFPAVFAFTIQAVARGDTLVIRLGSERRTFVRVDSLLLRETSTGAPLAIRRGPGGNVSHLFTGLPSGGAELPGAFERVPWYEGAYFLNEYVSALLGLPLLVLGAWGLFAAVRFWWRRRRGLVGATGPVRRVPLAAVLVAVVAAAAFLVFGFGFVAAATRDLGRGQGIAYGMTGQSLLLLRLAWPVALAAVPIGWWAVTAWRRRWWGVVDRVAYSLLAVLAIGQAHFLVWWGYVPGRW